VRVPFTNDFPGCVRSNFHGAPAWDLVGSGGCVETWKKMSHKREKKSSLSLSLLWARRTAAAGRLRSGYAPGRKESSGCGGREEEEGWGGAEAAETERRVTDRSPNRFPSFREVGRSGKLGKARPPANLQGRSLRRRGGGHRSNAVDLIEGSQLGLTAQRKTVKTRCASRRCHRSDELHDRHAFLPGFEGPAGEISDFPVLGLFDSRSTVLISTWGPAGIGMLDGKLSAGPSAAPEGRTVPQSRD